MARSGRKSVAPEAGHRGRRPGRVEEARHLRGAQLQRRGEATDVRGAGQSLAALPAEHRGRVHPERARQRGRAEGEGLPAAAQVRGCGGGVGWGHGGRRSVSSGLISGERSHSRATDVSILSGKHPDQPLTDGMLALTLGPVTPVTRGETAPLTWRRPVVKKTLIAACAITMSTLTLSACGGSELRFARTTATITMGFAQVGAESGWRTANTKSIQESAKAAGRRPEVLRRAAEAGEPDQGDPLLHPAEGRRHRLQPGRRDRLGRRPAGGQARRTSR